MRALKKIFWNRLMVAVLLVGAMIASTGCDELNQLRNLMNLAVPILQSPLAGPLQGDMPDFGGFDSFDDF